jgi:hypothetical protein
MTCTAVQTPTWKVWAMDSDRHTVRDMWISVESEALGVKTRRGWRVSAPPHRRLGLAGATTPGGSARGRRPPRHRR